MSSHLKIIIVLVTLAIPVPFIACGSASDSRAAVKSTPSNSGATATPTPDELAASRELYKTNCAKCHQDSGRGGKSVVDGKNIDAKDLTSDRMKKRDDDKFVDDISEGSPEDGMPAFKSKLSNSQINDVIKYIRAELQSAPTK